MLPFPKTPSIFAGANSGTSYSGMIPEGSVQVDVQAIHDAAVVQLNPCDEFAGRVNRTESCHEPPSQDIFQPIGGSFFKTIHEVSSRCQHKFTAYNDIALFCALVACVVEHQLVCGQPR